MNTVTLLYREFQGQKENFWVIAALFCLFTSVNLMLLSYAIGLISAGQVPPDLFLVSLAAIAFATLARQAAMFRTITALEHTIFGLRSQLLDRLKRIELYEFERIGADTIYDSVATGTRLLSETAGMLTKLLIVGVRAGAVLFALIWISQVTLLIVLFICLLVTLLYLWIRFHTAKHVIPMEEHQFFETFNHLLKGFKELKFHRRKGDELCEMELNPRLAESCRVKVAEGKRVALSYVLTEGVLLLLGGLMIFVLPAVLPGYAEVVVKGALIAITLPTSMLRDMPVITNADKALAELAELEQALDKAGANRPDEADAAPLAASFQRLELVDVLFRYTDHEGHPSFHVGPLSLTLEPGTLTFIVGGNGSGKSTLMKLLTGLYPPFSGEVRVNGQPVERGGQRGLFSAIFYDFHLFDRLYGMEETEPERVNGLLADLGLEHKIRYGADGFSDLALSTGQRKRVALVAALLEDRPIYVLDEWAADQDPETRERFYRELLPMLKARGKTVVAVTHDDRYFHLADQVLHMVDGHFRRAASASSV